MSPDRPPRPKETVRYWRTPLLPGADLVTAEYHNHAFTPHWHDAYTIPAIVSGAETYHARGARYVAETGTVPVINPGELHTGSKATDEGWQYRVLYAPVDYLHALADTLADARTPLPWFAPGVIRDTDLAARLARAHAMLEAGADPLAAEAAMLDALSTLLVRHAGTRPRNMTLPHTDTRIATMQARLADDLTAHLTLADLADATGLSPFHAARLFSRATGLPPHAWRNQVRLQRSLAPLRAGASVSQVALDTGFADQSHYSRHFRRMFGVPPGRWQQG